MQGTEKALFWQRILDLIDAIEASDSPRQELENHLESIDAIYRGAFDPVDDYPEFLVAKLCHSLETLNLPEGDKKQKAEASLSAREK